MTQKNENNTHDILLNLGLAESEIDIYLSLLSHGALSASELVRLIQAKRPTVYYALRQLLERGLVTKSGQARVERFQAAEPEQLVSMVKVKRNEMDALADKIEQSLDLFRMNIVRPAVKPHVFFYEGEKAMKQAIMDSLYCKKRQIDSLAPADNFFWQIGQEFSQRYIDERVQRGITTRNLWEKPLEPKILLKSYKGLAEVRVLPRNLCGRFKTTMFIYDDQVMYISSRDAKYVLVIRSEEHAEMMRMMYDGLWQASTKVVV